MGCRWISSSSSLLSCNAIAAPPPLTPCFYRIIPHVRANALSMCTEECFLPYQARRANWISPARRERSSICKPCRECSIRWHSTSSSRAALSCDATWEIAWKEWRGREMESNVKSVEGGRWRTKGGRTSQCDRANVTCDRARGDEPA